MGVGLGSGWLVKLLNLCYSPNKLAVDFGTTRLGSLKLLEHQDATAAYSPSFRLEFGVELEFRIRVGDGVTGWVEDRILSCDAGFGLR